MDKAKESGSLVDESRLLSDEREALRLARAAQDYRAAWPELMISMVTKIAEARRVGGRAINEAERSSEKFEKLLADARELRAYVAGGHDSGVKNCGGCALVKRTAYLAESAPVAMDGFDVVDKPTADGDSTSPPRMSLSDVLLEKLQKEENDNHQLRAERDRLAEQSKEMLNALYRAKEWAVNTAKVGGAIPSFVFSIEAVLSKWVDRQGHAAVVEDGRDATTVSERTTSDSILVTELRQQLTTAQGDLANYASSYKTLSDSNTALRLECSTALTDITNLHIEHDAWRDTCASRDKQLIAARAALGVTREALAKATGHIAHLVAANRTWFPGWAEKHIPVDIIESTDQHDRETRAPLEAEIERLRVQLAGCGVAALGGTSEAQVAQPYVYGWSPAYQDTLDLRRRYDQQAERVASLTASLGAVPPILKFALDTHGTLHLCLCGACVLLKQLLADPNLIAALADAPAGSRA